MSNIQNSNKKPRALFHQMLYACNQQTNYGADKHSLKRAGTNTRGTVYSITTKKNQVDTIRNFTNFMKTTYPNIRMVRDIQKEHVEAWFQYRSPHWSNATCNRHQSEMRTITKQIRSTYYTCKNIDFGFKAKLPDREPNHLESKRIAMSKEDLDIIRGALKDSRSQAKTAIEVSYRAGLRVREVCYLSPENIHVNQDRTQCSVVIEKGIHGGAKGGRGRTVSIYDKKDIEYFSDLKATTQRLGFKTVVNGVKPDSIHKALDRACQKVDRDFAERMTHCRLHGTRKLFSRGRLDHYLKQGMDRTAAEDKVISDIGHNGRREELVQCYLYK